MFPEGRHGWDSLQDMAAHRRRPLPEDRPLPWRRHGSTLLLSGLVLALLYGFARSPDAVERLYVQGVGTSISRLLGWATSYVPVSVAELLLAILVLWLVLAPLPAMVQVLRRRRRLGNAMAAGLLRVASLGAATAAVFYLSWGLHYARAPALERFGWERVELSHSDAVEELARLAADLIEITNRHYLLVHGTDDAGTPTAREVDLDRVLDEAYVRVADALALDEGFANPRGPAKPLTASAVSSWFGIGGFYFPFTGEANYNTLPPGWQQPHTIAHEKAHQRGIASEDEANFFGFLATIHADDPYVAYSGWLFAQRRLVRELAMLDPERARTLIGRRLPGVRRDIQAGYEFWASWQGTGHTIGHTVNHAYLTANRVEGGTRSYSMSAHLIVAWARERGGRLAQPGS